MISNSDLATSPSQNDLATSPSQNDLVTSPSQNDLATPPSQNDLTTLPNQSDLVTLLKEKKLINLQNQKNFIFRQIQEADLSLVSEIEAYSFTEPWSKASIASTLCSDNMFFYCMLIKTDILSKQLSEQSEELHKCNVANLELMHTVLAGYVGLNTVCGETEITNVAIRKELRGLGLGNKLISLLIEEEKKKETRKLFLEVRESNLPAIRTYKSNGFVETGLRKNFYKKPTESAILMELAISK
jgi:ribosomal-protein-alanine N-acetyltransferase